MDGCTTEELSMGSGGCIDGIAFPMTAFHVEDRHRMKSMYRVHATILAQIRLAGSGS